MKGKNVVITGANTGIGRITAREIAKLGGNVIVCARSKEKSKEVLEETKGEFVSLDLADLESTRKAADEVASKIDRIDVLIDNAGVAGQRGLTKQGFELAFGTNNLGHFLFTTRLLPKMNASSRVVVVSSIAHYKAKGIDWDAVRQETKSYVALREYQVSKLCNVLFVRELAKRSDVHTYAVHPGVIASEIWRRIPWPIRPLMMMRMKTPEQGARSSLHCATAESAGNETGLYYDEDATSKEPSEIAKDPDLARELWKRSEEWIKPFTL